MSTTPHGLVEATFEAMQVGVVLGPIELVVDDHYVKQYAFSVDDYGPLLRGEPTAQASVLVPELVRLLNTVFDPNTEVALHQREEIEFHSAVRIGERVRLTGELVDRYVKRGKGYVVAGAEARSLEDGRLLVSHRSTEVGRVDDSVAIGAGTAGKPARHVRGEWPEDVAPVARVSADLPAGTPILGPRKEVHQDQMAVFSNVKAFWRNIHTDLDVARKAGSDRTIAQGLMEAMYLSEMATDFFGPPWYESGWMSLTFLAPMHAGDVVTCRGVVLDPAEREDPERFEAEAWVENADGVKLAVGWIGARA